MAEQVSSLIVRLVDQVTGPAKAAGRALLGLGRAAKGGSGVTFTDRLDATMARNKARITQYRAQMVDAIATIYVLGRTLSAPIEAARGFETALTELGVKSGMSAERLAAFGKEAIALSKVTNQSTADLLNGADILIGYGMDADTAAKSIGTIGTTATATGASIEDLAKLGTASILNLKVPVEELQLAFDKLAFAGKAGGFELKDMAQYFPDLGAAFATFGQSGVGAVTDLGAALQIIKRSTGDTSQAANALANLLQKARAPLTVAKFKDVGIDIRKELDKGIAAGKSPIDIIVEQTQKAQSKGAILEDLFSDKQVLEAMRPLLQFFDDYKKMREEASKAAGVVLRDFETKMQTNAERTKAFQITLENLSLAVGNALLPALTSIMERLTPVVEAIGRWAEAHPKLTVAVVGSLAGLLALNAALALIKYSTALGYGGLLSIVSVVTRLGAGAFTAAANQVALTNALGAMSGEKLTGLQTLTTSLKAMAVAVPGVSGLAGAMSAVGAAVAAVSAPVWIGIAVAVGLVAAAAYSLWKYWDRISSFVGGFASTLMTELQPAFEALEPVMRPISALARGIGDGYKWASDSISEFIGWLNSFFDRETLTEEQKGKYSKSGSDLAEAMITSIKTAFNDLMTWFAGLPARIVAAIGSIDLSGILKWPTMPAWLGGGETAAPAGPIMAPTHGANDNSLPRKARGGPVYGGRSYLVGERGPEIFTPGSSGGITPNHRLGGTTIAPTINIAINGNANASTVEDIRRVLRDEVQRAFRGVYADAGMRFA